MIRKKINRPEDEVQKGVVDQLKVRAAEGVVWWHTPNGGKMNPRTGARLKRLGVLAGFPDLAAVKDGELYCMELKAPNGRVTDAQRDVLSRLEKAGAYTSICFGLDPAIRVLEAWKILKGKAA
jgi:hypothetical protein